LGHSAPGTYPSNTCQWFYLFAMTTDCAFSKETIFFNGMKELPLQFSKVCTQFTISKLNMAAFWGHMACADQ